MASILPGVIHLVGKPTALQEISILVFGANEFDISNESPPLDAVSLMDIEINVRVF